MKILIYEARTQKNMSLRKLSYLTKISKSALHRYENNKTSPRIDHLERIARVLKCRISDLYDSKYK